MDLEFVREIYRRPGPFLTVHLDTSRDATSANSAIALRWRAVREAVEGEGADSATLDAVESYVDEPDHRAGRHGTFVVASGGRVVFASPTPAPPEQGWGRWGSVPSLVPYLRVADDDLPYVLAAVDRVSADITMHSLAGDTERHLEGETLYVTKVAQGDWAHPQFQRRSENLWRDNAREVAEVVDRLATTSRARVVVVAGDVRARQLLVEQLSARSAELARVVDAGGHAEGASQSALAAAARQVVSDARAAEIERLADYYRERAAGGLASEGVAAVTRALEQGRAAHLLFGDLDGGGERPLAAERLVKLAAETDAELTCLPPNAPVQPRDGVGAILRY